MIRKSIKKGNKIIKKVKQIKVKDKVYFLKSLVNSTMKKSNIALTSDNGTEHQIDKSSKKKKNLVGTIISYILVVICLSMLVYVSVMKITNKQVRFFGYSFHYVVTNSMEPEINVGDFVVAKKVDLHSIKVGDYIVFNTDDPSLTSNNIKEIIHKVVEIKENEDGSLEFTTRGIRSDITSNDPYSAKRIIGLYVGKSSFVGSLYTFLTNPISWVIILVGIGAIWLSVKYFIHVYSDYKKEERENLSKELKTEIEKESDKDIKEKLADNKKW